MTSRLLISFIILTFLTLRCYTQEISNDERLRSIAGQYGQADVTIPLTDINTLNNLTKKFSITSVKDNLVYISLSQATVESFILQNLNYTIIGNDKKRGVISSANLIEAWDWQTYPTYSQYDSIMQDFNSRYPDLCHLDTIGTSKNGKLILALKISDNASADEDEPEVFYSSTMHGDELAGYVLMLRLIDYLLKNYNLSSRAKNIIDNLEIWINPLANPDGTYGTGNVISSPVRFNADGEDLNRNFPDPLDPFIVVPRENIDMIKFMRKHRFVLSANFHSGYEVVNYPWDRWLSKFHADDIWFNSISRAYADTVHIYSGTGYMTKEDNGVTRGAEWYVIWGGRQDFVTWELHGREVTVEIDDVKETPAAQLELLWQYNWRSFLGYIENALYGIHGLVRNSKSEAPLAAKVFITGHDKDSSHVFSDTLQGRFIRLLAPGSWDLTFSARGYYDTILTSVTVFSGMRTDVTVNMRPIANYIDPAVQICPILYPNPARAEMKALLPDALNGTVNVKIIGHTGRLSADYETIVTQGNPLIIDVSRLPGGSYSIVFTDPVSGIFYQSRFVVVK